MSSKDKNNAFLGTTQKSIINYPLNALKKHFIAMGASGSGKTVLCKVLIEETILKNIPSILIDPQGDITSLILNGDRTEIKKKGLDPDKIEELREKAEITIYTPTSSKGIPLCLNPLKLPTEPLDEEDLISIINQISTSLAKLIGYKDDDKGKSASSILYLILKYYYDKHIEINNFKRLITIISNLPEELKKEAELLMVDFKELIKKIKLLTIGEKELLFQKGIPLNVSSLLYSKNKPKVSIIYLNTLESPEDKEFFLSILATNLYQWMLAHPSKDLQAAFYIDEVAPYIPAGNKKPATKPILRLIYKQARKYGVGCVISTQNPGDIDYTCFSQFGTWAIGRLTTKQDRAKIKDAIHSLAGDNTDKIIETLPKLKAGEFVFFCPDVFESIQNIKVRWLYTQHLTLTDNDIKKLTKPNKQTKQNATPTKLHLKEKKIDIPPSPHNSDLLNIFEEKKESLCFPININKTELEEISQKYKKKWFGVGPSKEKLSASQLIFKPVFAAHIQVTESRIFGLKNELLEYLLYFDSLTGNILKISEKNFKIIGDFPKIIDETKTSLEKIKNNNHNFEFATRIKNLSSDLIKMTNIKLNDPQPTNHSMKFSEYQNKQPKISKEQLKTTFESWFKNSKIIKMTTVFHPIYQLTYTSKKRRRQVFIDAVAKKRII